MPRDILRSQAGNPYRRPRPKPNEIVAAGKFYLANEKGSYGSSTSPVYLALCREYLWVSDTLSIPLSSITEASLSKHGGFVRFWDAIAGVEMDFNFTKIGFLRFKRRDVETFLALLVDHLPEEATNPDVGRDFALFPDDSFNCEVCGSTEVYAFVFEVLRFVGIAPIVYSYSLTPFRYVLCAEHARTQARNCSLRTALTGYLGFPGFLAAPWYVCRNLWALHRAGIADCRTILVCLLSSVVLPWALIATPIILLTR